MTACLVACTASSSDKRSWPDGSPACSKCGCRCSWRSCLAFAEAAGDVGREVRGGKDYTAGTVACNDTPTDVLFARPAEMTPVQA